MLLEVIGHHSSNNTPVVVFEVDGFQVSEHMCRHALNLSASALQNSAVVLDFMNVNGLSQKVQSRVGNKPLSEPLILYF